MVDVGDKPITQRTATASGCVRLQPATLEMIRRRELSKGDVCEVARLAGIMAAKRTPELIPLCHTLPLDSVRIEYVFPDDRSVRIEATVSVTARTGVEMEALTAVQIGLLTVYDMCKAADRGMVMGEIRVLQKSGGKSGDWVAAV